MPRRLPSLNALKAFEAAARHGSFTRAAEELCVTQGAVSHQVKALEGELGLMLFRRERQRLVITEAGRTYLETVRDAFDRLAAGTERLLQRQGAGSLTVSSSPNFAAKWLVHRLARFAEVHPGIELRIGAAVQHVDFARDDVDLAIRHGDGHWPGLHVARLCVERLFPVCSPALLRGRRGLRSPADLARHTLLHLNDRQDWAKWFEVAGARGIDLARGPVFDQAHLVIDAAIGGQGVALARTALVAWDLLAGRLACPFGPALAVPYAYWIVCPKATAAQPKIVAFRNWLLTEAEGETRRLAEHGIG
jgi:LysR family glycine cleavage system transcriptional activator